MVQVGAQKLRARWSTLCVENARGDEVLCVKLWLLFGKGVKLD
jgi:hypothetical protein